jgi:hypothetical protein
MSEARALYLRSVFAYLGMAGGYRPLAGKQIRLAAEARIILLADDSAPARPKGG